jgi:hypothetical protein
MAKLGGEEKDDGKRRTWHDDWKADVKAEEARREKEETRAEKERKDEEKRVMREKMKVDEEKRLAELRRTGFVARYTG